MKKTAVFLLFFVLLAASAAIPAAAEDVRCRVEFSAPGDYGFLVLGESVNVAALLEGATDASFSPKIQYAVETGQKNAAVGFVWKSVKKTDAMSAVFKPEREGLFFFSAEGKVSGHGTVSSLDTGWPSLLVVDPEKKKTVATRDDFLNAVKSRSKIISVSGDLTLENAGDVQVSRMTVLEVPAGSSLRLAGGTSITLDGTCGGTGRFLLGGSLAVGENSSLNCTGNGELFCSGSIEGREGVNMTVTRCNLAAVDTAPLFTVDNASGMTAQFEGLGNFQFLQSQKISPDSEEYLLISEIAPGEVVCAYKTAVGGYEGRYKLSVPLDERYEGAELELRLVLSDGNVTTERLVCSGGRVSFLTDRTQSFMLVLPEPESRTELTTYLLIMGAALLLMTAAVIPLIIRKIKRRQGC